MYFHVVGCIEEAIKIFLCEHISCNCEYLLIDTNSCYNSDTWLLTDSADYCRFMASILCINNLILMKELETIFIFLT